MTLILMILATVLLICAAFGVSAPRVSLGWLGMGVWALSIVLSAT